MRKPNPGMLLRAAELLVLDLGRSIVVGDKPADMEAGRRAGLAAGWLVGDEMPDGGRASGSAAAGRPRIGRPCVDMIEEIGRRA